MGVLQNTMRKSILFETTFRVRALQCVAPPHVAHREHPANKKPRIFEIPQFRETVSTMMTEMLRTPSKKVLPEAAHPVKPVAERGSASYSQPSRRQNPLTLGYGMSTRMIPQRSRVHVLMLCNVFLAVDAATTLLMVRHGEGIHQRKYIRAGIRGTFARNKKGDYFLTKKGQNEATFARKLQNYLMRLKPDDLGNVVFLCSPLSRPLQTLYNAVLPVLKQRRFKHITIRVKILPGLRERQMQADSSCLFFLHGLKKEVGASQKITLLRDRHFQALRAIDLESFKCNRNRFQIDYREMLKAFRRDWHDGYSDRKATIKGWVEPEAKFRNSALTFVEYLREKCQGKTVVAFCHGGTMKMAMKILRCKTLDGKAIPGKFHIGNVDTIKMTVGRSGFVVPCKDGKLPLRWQTGSRRLQETSDPCAEFRKILNEIRFGRLSSLW